MNASIPYPGRLHAYERLFRILRVRSYAGKFLLITFGAAHIPLLALTGYLLFASNLGAGSIWRLLFVALIATLVGTTIALTGIWILLAPVAAGSNALTHYRESASRAYLPTTIPDEGGRLLANIQITLDHLDDLIENLRESASRDELTGSYNRRAALQRLEQMLGDLDQHPGRISLTVVDADNLKYINDTWGHTAGDAAILHLARTVTSRLGSDGWVARWGGDEFVIIVKESPDQPVAERIVAQILADIKMTPVTLRNGTQFTMNVSAGSSYAEHGDDPGMLFERADAILYRTKNAKQPGAIRTS